MSGLSRWCRWVWSTTGCTMVRAAPAMHTATGESVAKWAARETFATATVEWSGHVRGQSAQPHKKPPNAATVAGQVRLGCPGASGKQREHAEEQQCSGEDCLAQGCGVDGEA